MMKARTTTSCRPLRGLDGFCYAVLLGLRAAALHPRLYSVARIRGLGFRMVVLIPGGFNNQTKLSYQSI
jgi:hypothetical protein